MTLITRSTARGAAPVVFSANHQATPISLTEKCYYPDAQVYEAIGALKSAGHIVQIQNEGDTVQYRPSAEILQQMSVLNAQADTDLRSSLEEAKRQMDGDEPGLKLT